MQPRYQALEAYVPGEQPQDQVYIKLNTNESPYSPGPGTCAVLNGMQAAQLRLYSDPACVQLRRTLAQRYGVQPENVFVSNGSDDVLNFAFAAFSGENCPAYFPDITYGFYPVFAQLHGVPFHTVPLQADFRVNPADYMDRDGMIVIANPNAPTGLTLPVSDIEQILQRNPDHVVVIDEAYVDFGAASCVPLTSKYDNLLVVQTYSKSRSLAGARLGYAIGSAALIADLEKIKFSTNPYSVNRMTLAAGAAALDEDDYYAAHCRDIIRTRENTTAQLLAMGFEVLDSQANFVFARHPKMDGGRFYQELKRRGVLVRHFTAPRIAQFNRITIGTPEQMDVLLNTTAEILKEGVAAPERS